MKVARQHRLAQTIMLFGLCAASVVLLWHDRPAALGCLPLLVGGWAQLRGRAWGPLLLLGGSVSLLGLVLIEVAPQAAILPAWIGLSAYVLALPLLWRLDALAAVGASVVAVGIGLALPAGRLLDARSPERPPHDARPPKSLSPIEAAETLDACLPAARGPSPLRLALEPGARPDQPVLALTNTGDRPVAAVVPKDLAYAPLLAPTFTLRAVDAQGRKLIEGPVQACGGVYPVLTTKVLPARATYRVRIGVPWFMYPEGTKVPGPLESLIGGKPMPKTVRVARLRITYRVEPGSVIWLFADLGDLGGSRGECERISKMAVGRVSSPDFTRERAVEHGQERARSRRPGPAQRGAPDVRLGPTKVERGTANVVALRRAIRRQLDGARRCLAIEAARNPWHRGQATVLFTIQPSGRTRGVGTLSGATINNVEAVDCLARAVDRWVFPPRRNGGGEVVLQQQIVQQPVRR